VPRFEDGPGRSATALTTYTQQRVSIRAVTPQVDGGRFRAKRVAGEPITVEADVYADSHDVLSAVVRWRPLGRGRAGAKRNSRSGTWLEERMEPLVNDRWTATFSCDEPGRVEFTVVGWVDRYATWLRDIRAKVEARVATDVDFAIGAELLEELARDAGEEDTERLSRAADVLRDDARFPESRRDLAASGDIVSTVRRLEPRPHATTYDQTLQVQIDRPLARCSAWYELFPRSASPDPDRHGTLTDVIDRLPYVESMGFDVLYLPPIHPIGRSHRKGRNNTTEAGPGDPGSPWAIGAEEGGHKSIHPDLGTLDDFRKLVSACHDHGLELALDIAFQCSPDHPYVREHPEWFEKRPDGTIQYAENPPKKYQDIYPFDFETSDPEGLWNELRSVFEFWIDEGVRIFRVDNPHTKSFRFWEWCIGELTREHPDLIFLAEAFTRPKVMYELAKVGFTQSYTYFAWRHQKWEFEQYYTELFRTEVADFFRSNAWPNTPDILTGYLQVGGRNRFAQRLILAATISANYGIYGPPFELQEHLPRPGAEEYLDNEKYERRHWDLEAPHSLAPLIGRVNRIRRQHPALQQDRGFAFHHVDNEALLAYSKSDPRTNDTILVVVNLDPDWTQEGMTWLDADALGIDPDGPFTVRDLLGDGVWTWHGQRNYVRIDPHVSPAHIFVVER
jgi:starch synthase (maltosyl-transferring)